MAISILQKLIGRGMRRATERQQARNSVTDDRVGSEGMGRDGGEAKLG